MRGLILVDKGNDKNVTVDDDIHFFLQTQMLIFSPVGVCLAVPKIPEYWQVLPCLSHRP